MDVCFYEVFAEEEKLLKQFLPAEVKAGFFKHTIQEAAEKNPPSKLISIRTQSDIPLEWHDKVEGIFTRSQGFDHLIAYRREAQTKLPLGYIGNYSDEAVAEHAFLALMF